ncbi:hypothetical protein QQX98_001266 [Neonectria punicea]|uniref:SnoaL-like domain-containing protein n=1 Tax=Neonectria punicea TaxID=979145 RepID=A0ABR1HPS3_9HYPO
MRVSTYTLVASAFAFTASAASAFAITASAAISEAKAPYCPPRPASIHEQREIFYEFNKKLLIDYNSTSAIMDHVAEDYIQHNPLTLSGRDRALSDFAFISPDTVNFTVFRQGVDANIGYVHVRMHLAGDARPMAVVDLFRFNGSCIQEHWGVVMEQPANSTNPLPMW